MNEHKRHRRMAGSPAALGRRTFFRRPEQQTGAISAHRLFDPHFPALAFRRGTHSVHRHGPDESHGVKRLYCGSAARSSFQRRGRLLRAFRMRYRRHGLPHLQRRVAARRNHIEQKRRTRDGLRLRHDHHRAGYLPRRWRDAQPPNMRDSSYANTQDLRPRRQRSRPS